MMPPKTLTGDGFELQFGTNHLGHFALTGLLLGHVLRTPDSRVVNVASLAHRRGAIDFDDLQWSSKKYDRMLAYAQSKLANLLFTLELQRRLEAAASSTIAVSAHPGWTATNLQRHAGGFRFLGFFISQKSHMGALPTLFAAVDPSVGGGDYFGPGGWQEIRGHPKRVQPVPAAKDGDVAARLWDVSAELTGAVFAA
jgi:NAD(P)-dependent dehydrogenase (short-subunit alcohol dehydrogenase family)